MANALNLKWLWDFSSARPAMSNLAVDTNRDYSDENLSQDTTEVVRVLRVQPERRVPVALSWIIIVGVSAGLWIVITDLSRWLLP